jgi:Cu2+-exporting ATPase
MQDHDAHAGHDMHGGHDAHAGHAMHEDHDAHAGHDMHGGHGAHMGHDPDAFRDRFWLSFLLSVPVLLFSTMVQEWLGFEVPRFPGDDLIAPLAGAGVFLYGGWPFLTGAVAEARARRPGMMLLIGLALTVALVASLASLAGWLEIEFWWELALLVDVMLLGHWLELRAVGRASSALDALAALLPDRAERVVGTGTESVDLQDLRVDDRVLVRPGGRVPADGVVVDGEAAFDESMITGESRPVRRAASDRVVAGTVATDSSVRVRVTAVGEATALAGIRRLVAEAQASRSGAQALADRAAAVLFYVALASGAVTLVAWSALGRPDQALERTVTVLVIACPHALGLAIPLVIAISTSISAQAGILVKDRLALERMRTIDTVLLDKTGTLTTGRPSVTDVAGDDPDAVLTLAAAAEASSEHPLAAAIVREGERRGLAVPPASGFRSIPGRGVTATVDGTTVAVGGPALLRELDVSPRPELESRVAGWRGRGASVVTVVRNGSPMGAIALEDTVRPGSRDAVGGLRATGIRPVMITGDAREVAEAIAGDLGIEEVHAEVLPERKAAVVSELQALGRRVAMVGDGVNDAPALAQADVGIAIGAGTDVAIGSAGVILAGDDPRAVLGVVRLSRASYAKMIQNLVWATGYNAVALPLAAGVLAWAGVVLPPAVGALAMSLSTVVVALNALLLRRLDLRPDRVPTDRAGTR